MMRSAGLVLCLIAFLLIVDDSSAQQKHRKHKKFKSRHHGHHKLGEVPPSAEPGISNYEPENAPPLPPLPEMPRIVEEVEPEAPVFDWRELHPAEDARTNNVPIADPCLHKHCGAGRVCRRSEATGDAECLCITSCPLESDPRRKVCTNHNETWGSDCEVYQMQCFCEEGGEKCTKEAYEHIQIDYYGHCRDMPTCTEEEMSDFPRRMRDWLFNIMRDLADREELSPHYLKLEKEAETNMTRRWSNAAVWKWCDLDGHPHDRSVSRHELFPIRAPLLALEHCIAPFLNSCDKDDDHRITLTEWAKCLDLDEDDLEDRCEEVRGDDDE